MLTVLNSACVGGRGEVTQRPGKSKGAAFNFWGQILYWKPGLLGFHFLLLRLHQCLCLGFIQAPCLVWGQRINRWLPDCSLNGSSTGSKEQISRGQKGSSCPFMQRAMCSAVKASQPAFVGAGCLHWHLIGLQSLWNERRHVYDRACLHWSSS